MSPARAAELARDKVRGARALQAIAADAPRYTNLLLLLRLVCELTATTLVALVLLGAIEPRLAGRAGHRGVDDAWSASSWSASGPRTIGRQHAYAVGRVAAPLVLLAGPGARSAGHPADPDRQRGHARASASARARSRPRSSCASWSTWPSSGAWWSTTSAT